LAICFLSFFLRLLEIAGLCFVVFITFPFTPRVSATFHLYLFHFSWGFSTSVLFLTFLNLPPKTSDTLLNEIVGLMSVWTIIRVLLGTLYGRVTSSLSPDDQYRLSVKALQEPGSSGSIVSGYGLDDRAIGVRSPAREKEFSSSLCVQTSWGPPAEAHPASCTMGTGGPFPGGKARPGRDADHSPLSSAEVEYE
jgi:hypothetical protein